MIRYSTPSSLISWPEYLPKRMVSPAFTSSFTRSPSSLHLAVARGDHLAPLRFFLGGIRDDDAADLLFAFVEALNEYPVV